MSGINIYLRKCEDFMRETPDKHYDLAIVDPPYGILSKAGNRLDKYGTDHKTWDEEPPGPEYFAELFRVSKHQIIWGGNYFPQLWADGCKGFVFWYKHQPVTNWAAGEFAWTSFDRPARCFDYPYYGNINADPTRSHPTQKPVKLYKWLLNNYAERGWKIFDSHLGSGTHAIACADYGFELDACEKHEGYYQKAIEKLATHRSQLKIF